MKTFLLDLVHDLREKRLWPVAVALLAALVAVPVVLSQSSEAPPPPVPEAPEARTAPEPKELAGLADVKLEETAASAGSSLDTFDPSDPFRPPRTVMSKARQEAAGAGPGSGADAGPADSGGDGASASSGGGGGGAPADTGGDTGSGDTGSGGDAGGGDTGSGGDPGTGDTPTETTQFVYVVDVTFRANGRTRHIKGMERLDMLPSEASPLLLFLGVTAEGGNAVFLVDSTLQAAGEGRCKPSGSDCAFLHIGPGSEHEFTNDVGDSYVLEIDEIRKVKVGAKPARSSQKKKTRAARAAVGADNASTHRFIPPFLADIVSVSSASGGDSDHHQDRR